MQKEKYKVLTIDSDEEQNTYYKTYLGQYFDIETCQNYDEAIEKISANFIPELILLDYSFPEDNGIDVYDSLKTLSELSDTKFIFVSKTKSEEIKKLCYEMGSVDYIEKPVSIVDIFYKAQNLFNQISREKTFKEEIEKMNVELNSMLPVNYIGMHTLQLVHNMKNILTILNGNIALLRNNVKDEDPEENGSLSYLKNIRDASERINEIVRLILDNTKARSEIIPKKLDLNGLIKDEVLFFGEFKKDGKKIEFIEEYADLPKIEGIYSHFSQIFANLLVNAYDSMEQKQINSYLDKIDQENANIYKKQIQIKTELIDGINILITISDNGMGIKKENLEKIFDPFFSTKKNNRFHGSGIGLSFVKNMIEKYGGGITVQSIEGEGASFMILLPLNEENI